MHLFQSGWTPLTVASFNGKVSSVQTLIEAKAETDTQDKVVALNTIRKHTPHGVWWVNITQICGAHDKNDNTQHPMISK